MKKVFLALCASVSLVSCAGMVPPGSPSEIADRTVLDEKGAILAQDAYMAWNMALGFLVDIGKIKGADAERFARIDKALYDASYATYTAYNAGNAVRYDDSLRLASESVKAAMVSLRAAAAGVAHDH